MSDQQDDEKFLSRWSRRKVQARLADPGEGPVDPGEAAAPAAPSGPGEYPAPTQVQTELQTESRNGAPLPSIEALRGLESEYRDFLRPGVDETLRRTALKKLFQDPHFNIMDGLDTYIDDYSKEDPIPEAMLKTLNQAKGLIFDREDAPGANETPAPAAAADAAGDPEKVSAPASPPPSPNEGETVDDAVAQSGDSNSCPPG